MKYGITEENIYGNVRENEKSYDLISVVIVCLSVDGQKSDEALLNMISVLLSDRIEPKTKKETLATEFCIPMTEELERGVERMCNLSQGVYDRAVDKITVEHIKSMMNNKGWDIEECMDILDIPEEKKEYYRDEVLGVVIS